MKSKLEIATNVSIIVLCLVVSAVLIKNHFLNRPGAAEEPIARGTRIESLQRHIPQGAERALFVAVSPRCGYCTESLPFYDKLVDHRNAEAPRVGIVAAVGHPEDVQEEGQMFRQAGVEVDAVVPVDFQQLGIPGTPTLLLVDRQGKVLGSWVGKLDASREKEVLKALS